MLCSVTSLCPCEARPWPALGHAPAARQPMRRGLASMAAVLGRGMPHAIVAGSRGFRKVFGGCLAGKGVGREAPCRLSSQAALEGVGTFTPLSRHHPHHSVLTNGRPVLSNGSSYLPRVT